MNRFPCGWWILPSCLLGLVLWFGIVGLVLADQFTIQWTEPTTREDGTYLPPEQIFAYAIYLDEVYIGFAFPGRTSTIINVDPSTQHIVTMRTGDTEVPINLSAPSNGVGIPITNPDAPGVCVVP